MYFRGEPVSQCLCKNVTKLLSFSLIYLGTLFFSLFHYGWKYINVFLYQNFRLICAYCTHLMNVVYRTRSMLLPIFPFSANPSHNTRILLVLLLFWCEWVTTNKGKKLNKYTLTHVPKSKRNDETKKEGNIVALLRLMCWIHFRMGLAFYPHLYLT